MGWAGKRTCMNALSSLTDDVQVTVWKRDIQREKVALYKHMVIQRKVLATFLAVLWSAIQRYTQRETVARFTN